MKIDRVEWWEVKQLVHQEMVNSPEYAATHERWDLTPKFLVRLTTDDGHYGVGETPRGTPLPAIQAGAQALLGREPVALNLRSLPLSGQAAQAYRAYETAVFDLVGRIRGMRVGELLGGIGREEVVTSYWAGLQAPEYGVTAARDATAAGYGCLKIKTMHGMDVIERLRLMHEAAPGVQFIVDAMQRYDDLGEMLELARRMEPYNVLCIEDPLPKDHLDWYRILRAEAPIPIAIHLGSTPQILDALKADAADIFNCSPSSIVKFVQMVDTAEAAGKPCWHGSGVDLGISDLAYIHACAVATNATVPSDILSWPLHLDDFVVEMPARRGDHIAVPPGPGLGGELDMQAVEENLISKGELHTAAG